MIDPANQDKTMVPGLSHVTVSNFVYRGTSSKYSENKMGSFRVFIFTNMTDEKKKSTCGLFKNVTFQKNLLF